MKIRVHTIKYTDKNKLGMSIIAQGVDCCSYFIIPCPHDTPYDEWLKLFVVDNHKIIITSGDFYRATISRIKGLVSFSSVMQMDDRRLVHSVNCELSKLEGPLRTCLEKLSALNAWD